MKDNDIRYILNQNGKEILAINDNLLILVAYNGKGKSDLLRKINTREYQISSFDKDIYYLGLKESTPDNILAKGGIVGEDSYRKYIKEHFIKDTAEMILDRTSYEKINDYSVEEIISYRRLVLLKVISLIKDKKAVLIDEPELQAHPAVLKEIDVILKDLSAQKNPVIITTNLDNVVDDLLSNPGQIAKIENLDKEVFVQADMKSVQKKVRNFYHRNAYLLNRFSASNQKDQGLNNIIEKNYSAYLGSSLTDKLFDVIFSDAVILGEGASEKILFRYVDKVLHPKWIRENKVTFVSCLGKSTIPLYFVFMNALGLKTICMFDKDKLTNPVHNAYYEAFKSYKEDNPYLFRYQLIDPSLEDKLHINPNYKLESIEKPVNVYSHAFLTSGIQNEVAALMKEWEELLKEMNNHEEK